MRTLDRTTLRASRPALLAAALLAFALTSPTLACGPGTSLTNADILTFQVGLIERGIARETLTDDQRAEIARLRAEVEMLQKADKREEAGEAMKKIVAMFKHKEMMGAVEPPVPGCAVPRLNVVAGMLLSIESEPNVAGARCGNHYVLSIKEVGGKGQVTKLAVYDLAKAPYAMLKAMLNKRVEVETLGTGVVGVRLAGTQQADAAGLNGLSPRKPC